MKKCEGHNCDKPAEVNIQKVWISWDIDASTGLYSKEHKILDFNNPTDGENWHLCKKCAEKKGLNE